MMTNNFQRYESEMPPDTDEVKRTSLELSTTALPVVVCQSTSTFREISKTLRLGIFGFDVLCAKALGHPSTQSDTL